MRSGQLGVSRSDLSSFRAFSILTCQVYIEGSTRDPARALRSESFPASFSVILTPDKRSGSLQPPSPSSSHPLAGRWSLQWSTQSAARMQN